MVKHVAETTVQPGFSSYGVMLAVDGFIEYVCVLATETTYLLLEPNAGLEQRGLEPLEAALARRLVRVALDVADAGVAGSDQMLGDLLACMEIINAHMRDVATAAARRDGRPVAPQGPWRAL